MVFEEKKFGEERLVKMIEIKDMKKYWGILEVFFLVSIYFFIIMFFIFYDSVSCMYWEIFFINV